MPYYGRKTTPNVDFWRAFGHSWFQYQTGPSGDQTGRVDALFRSAMDVEYNSWRNYASSGARIAGATRSLGGWTKIAQRVHPPAGRTYPYAPDGGGTIMAFGINDLNAYNGHLANVQNAMVCSHRAVISKARASREYFVTDAVFAYGAGWGGGTNASGPDLGMGTVDRLCSTTTAATITMTLPADYKGETVAFAFLLRPDTTGGTLTFSGTAGVTGTFYTANGLPAAMATHSYTVKRVTTLTAANAGQTIILTTTSLDASGNVFFDGAWLESLTPPPVIVCNVATPTTAGYAALAVFFTAWTSGNIEAVRDADVATYNASLATMLLEFDGMVQLADCNTPQLSKQAAMFADGIHPNEQGSALIVDAMIAARNAMVPPITAAGQSLGFNPPSPRVAGRRRVRTTQGPFYTSEHTAATANYTPVVGHFMAIPFEITESRDQWNQLCMEVTTAGSTTSTIRWGIYEDVNWDGYPGELLAGMDISSAGAFTVANSTGVKTSATFTSTFIPDPGMFWLAMKIDTVGTAQIFRALVGPSEYMPNLSATGLSVANGYTGWQATGLATGVLPGSFPTGAALMANAPMVGIKKSK